MARVLLHVNDDGVMSPGIYLTRLALMTAFRGRIVSLATEANGTGSGGAITFPYQRSTIAVL